jgi:ubiquitin-protein ligase
VLRSEGGVYKILLTFPPTYPNEPPEMRFATPLWHPNSARQARPPARPRASRVEA